MKTTLGQLSESWNVLRAATVRGTTPHPGVSSEVADRVTEAHEHFRAWLSTQGPLDELAAQVALSDDGQVWADLQAELAELVSAETGKHIPHAAETPVLRVMRAAGAIAAWPAALLLAAATCYVVSRFSGGRAR